MSYQKLGLKCGIEIHQQLEGKKLFCNCPTLLRDDDPHFTISRKQRAAAGEGGKIDIAAREEQLKGKLFKYEGYHDTTCLVETDSEPPHELNQDALYTCLQLCKLVNANVSKIGQVMRKTVVDGSNTSGFQRTALIARNGKIDTSEGEVRIDNISIEEEACKIISETADEKTYRLDRLGIPLIEIGTAPDIKSPEQCQEVSKKLGMLLRSLPGVKRGIGTIRQDVNISIKGGNRIEVKGFQDLKMIPTLVELEVKRQSELLKIKEELRNYRLNKFEVIDLSLILKDSEAKRIKDNLANSGKVLGLRLHGLVGFLGRELQPNYRLGSEFSGRAKMKAGVGGIFHSDELPNYGVSDKDVKFIKKKLQCDNKDAFVIVSDTEDKARRALEAVYERMKEVLIGVPCEVRKDRPDGTTTFMRSMPGAARMYPETDVPLIFPDEEVELPELLDEKIKRFQEEYDLGGDLASFVAKSDKVELFEEIVKKFEMKPAFVADVLTSMLVEIRRKYKLETSGLKEGQFRELFTYLSEDKIHKDIVLDVLIEMIKGTFDLSKYEGLSTEEIHAIVEEIVSSNKGAPFGALMGKCMKKLTGKASGEVISKVLKEIVAKGHK